MDKLKAIEELLSQIPLLEEDYCEDIHGWSGGNIDDAYSLGADYASSNIAKDIFKILES